MSSAIAETRVELAARRHDGSPLFTNVARGYKYYVNLRAAQIIERSTGIASKSRINLQWNGATSGSKGPIHPFTLEFLEPYRNGNCGSLHNCMACLTDAACAWCNVDSSCVLRENSSISTASTCEGLHPSKYLITSAIDCPVCADYVDCYSCSGVSLCYHAVFASSLTES